MIQEFLSYPNGPSEDLRVGWHIPEHPDLSQPWVFARATLSMTTSRVQLRISYTFTHPASSHSSSELLGERFVATSIWAAILKVKEQKRKTFRQRSQVSFPVEWSCISTPPFQCHVPARGERTWKALCQFSLAHQMLGIWWVHCFLRPGSCLPHPPPSLPPSSLISLFPLPSPNFAPDFYKAQEQGDHKSFSWLLLSISLLLHGLLSLGGHLNSANNQRLHCFLSC